jgi:hypothetical protein
MSFRQTCDDRIEIDSTAVYRFGPDLPKPCVHPLTTPRGHVLSGFEMSDHVWHRGLWFTIKFINQTNFWEEHAPFGVQVSRAQPKCQLVVPDALQISHLLDWTSGATGLVIREARTMTFRSDCDGLGIIDWTNELLATQDLLLDRTPYTTWGGYGGLSFRASRELHDAKFLLPGGETMELLTGQKHAWVAMHGKVDGGVDQHVSLAMIDHPGNPRSPGAWYGRTIPGFCFVNAAFLFHEPLTMKKEQTLRFRYRVLYRDGLWSESQLAALAESFRHESENP